MYFGTAVVAVEEEDCVSEGVDGGTMFVRSLSDERT
jgi:hypothetical protein